MKKALVIIGAVLVFLVVTIVAIPFFVNVNQFKEPIEKAIQEKVDGKVEIGELELSLWGGVYFDIRNFKLTDQKNTEVISFKNGSLATSYFAWLENKPEVTFVLEAPQIKLLKTKDGSWNLLSMMKTDESPDEGTEKETESESPPTKLPSFLQNAILGLNINKAKVQVDDFLQLKEVNFSIPTLSLTESTAFRFSSHLDYKTKDPVPLLVSGPVRIQGDITPAQKEQKIQSFQFNLQHDLSDLAISSEKLLRKPKGLKTTIDLTGSYTSEGSFKVEKLYLALGNLLVEGSAKADLASKQLSFQSQFVSNSFSLKEIIQLSPQAINSSKAFEPSASIRVEATASQKKGGHLIYQADVSIEEGSVKPDPKLKPLSFSSQMKVKTGLVEIKSFKLKGTGSDLSLRAKVSEWNKPKIKAQLSSKRIQTSDFMPPSSEKGLEQQSPKDEKSQTLEQSQSQKQLLSQPWLDQLQASIDLDLKQILYDSYRIKNAKGKFQLKNRNLKVRPFDFQAFDGKLGLQIESLLSKKKPSHRGSMNVQGLVFQNFMKAAFPSFSKTLSGTLNTDVNFRSEGLDAAELKNNMELSGYAEFKDGVLHLFDIVKIIQDSLKKVPGIEKISDLENKNYQAFRSLVSDYEMRGMNLNLSRVFMKGTQRGADLVTSGNMNLNKMQMKLNGRLIDQYGNLQRKEPKLKKFTPGKNKAFELPFRLTGSILSPSFDFEYTAKTLGKNYAKNQVSEERIKDAIKKNIPKRYQDKVDEKIDADKLKEKARDALKGLFD
jgi:uncharacterized protein involved in outer membrane biogenesis